MLTISRWDLKIKLMRRQGLLVLVIFILLGSCSQENSLPDSTATNPLFTLISPEFSGVDFNNLIVETVEHIW